MSVIGARSDHMWELVQNSYRTPSDNGLYMDEHPNGFGHFRCSCGIFEHGRVEDLAAVMEGHLGAEKEGAVTDRP